MDPGSTPYHECPYILDVCTYIYIKYLYIHTPLIYLGFINGCITLHSSPVYTVVSSAEALYQEILLQLFPVHFCFSNDFVSSSSPHFSRSFRSMSSIAQFSLSSLAISPLMRPAFFSLKETPSEGSILEIQTSASPLPSCSVNIKESGGDVPAPTALQPLTQMTKPDCQPPTG